MLSLAPMEEIYRRPFTLILIFIILLIGLTYGNTLHAPFNFDDSLVIQTEIAQHGEKYFQPFALQYRHLFYLSFALNYAQGKLDPIGYHLVNISLHLLTTLVLFLITHITIQRGSGWDSHAATPIAMLTCLLFAISPVHTETVTYISGRATGLAGLFFLSALLFFILANFREKSLASKVFYYLFSMVFFLASVLSKEISLTFPALILLYDFCFMKGGKWSSLRCRCLYYYLPMGLLGTLALFQVGFIKFLILEWANKIDLTYALQQSRILGHAIYLLLLPIGLTLDYDFPDTFFPPTVLCAWPLLLIALFLIGGFKYFPKSKKIVLFGVFWFLLTLAPTNSFLPRLDLLSERNLYIPSFGIFFLMGTFVYSFFLSQEEKFRKLGISFLVAIFVFQIALLIVRNTTYQSNITLWEDTVKKAPGKTRAWQNLSHYYLMELNYDKAFDSIQGLMRSNPSSQYLSQAHSKLGVIHSRQGNISKAIVAYKEGIRINPSSPINHLNIGGLYMKQGNFLEAKVAYENAERLFKNQSPVGTIPSHLYLNKAFILYNLGSFKQAETAALIYLSLLPNSNYAHSLLGNIYLALGKNVEAKREFTMAAKTTDSK